MNTYIALFRAINIGGKNILLMKDLVQTFEALGYSKIQTYIQSGNVVFQEKKKQIAKISDEINSGVLKNNGLETKVLLLQKPELKEIIDNNPFDTKIGKSLYFFFLDSLPNTPNLEKLNSLKTESESFKLYKKVFYFHAPEGIGRSKLAGKIEHALGVPATARNWNTVTKLLSMVEKNDE